MTRPRKQMYRIKHAGYEVEGLATSSQNAARLAFKKLLKAQLIKSHPPLDYDSPSSFKDTTVEVIKDGQ